MLYLVAVLIIGSVVNAVPHFHNHLKTLPKNRDFILPGTSIPNHYDLHLNVVDLDPNREYNGTVDIDLTVLKSVRELVLHSNKLKINLANSMLVCKDGVQQRFDVLVAVENSTNRFLTVSFGKQILPGNYILRLAFTGRYYTEPNGLFLDTYEDEKGNKKYLLATYLAPIVARDMFPCYDEPNLKATFRVTVTNPKKYNALSNMPIESVRTHGNTKTTTFQNTPKMSTYLLAIGVSDYETLHRHLDGKSVSIHVQPGKVYAIEFAMEILLKCLRIYQKLFQINYTLPKLDAYVVPQFESAGMENWGLIVYGPAIVAKNSTTEPMASTDLRTLVNLIVHEVSHQWFGDLVTLVWWDYLWLTEGFGTYYASRVSDMIYPNERFMDRNLLTSLDILKTESQLGSAESLNRHVISPAEINSKFNSISYDKGSAIVRFMQMTFKSFDRAMTHYLRHNAFDNTEPLDLFETINNHENLPGDLTVQKIMKSWSSNSGYPLLTINVSRQGYDCTVVFSQKKFSLERNNSPDKWWIPITLATESNPNFNDLTISNWLSDMESNTVMHLRNNGGWVIANLQKVAYMRVNYDLDNWRRIIEYLKGPHFEKIHYLNRMQLVDDSTALVRAKLLPENVGLELLTYLKQEKDEIVLEAAESSFKEYLKLLRGRNGFDKFQAFVVEILGSEKGGNLLKSSESETTTKAQ